MKHLFVILAILGLTVSCAVDRHGVIGAIFRLRDESPLPAWITLSSGVTRDQVTVTIVRYEEETSSKSKVRFIVRNKRRWIFSTIQEKIGEEYWHPDSALVKKPASTYPNWVFIEADGIKEVYEQSERNDLLKIVQK